MKLNQLISDSITVDIPTDVGHYAVPFLEEVIFGVFIVIVNKEYTDFKDAYSKAFHSQGSVHIRYTVQPKTVEKRYFACKYFALRKNAIKYALDLAKKGEDVDIWDTIHGCIITPTVREARTIEEPKPSKKSWIKVQEKLNN